MIDSAMFMIEGGPLLGLVKHHIQERKRVMGEVRELANELGVTEAYRDRWSGVISGVVFPRGQVHPEFTKPTSKGRISFPRKRTYWHKRLAAQVGHEWAIKVISDALNLPGSISYTTPGGSGVCGFSSILNECGFLYMTEDGPYAMWVPDVPAEVAAKEAEGVGYAVEEPAKSFKMDFEGCRRIDKEEWEILVLQQQFAEKRAAREVANG